LRFADLSPLRIPARANRRSGHRLTLLLCAVALQLACSSHPPQPSTGIAYAGPATLSLRKDLASKSPNVGSAKHGERLEILETRRRFVRVRTPQGVEGWTDANLLLTQPQMNDLHGLAESAARLPSQGAATVYEALNMHAEPSRQSPSFYQIPESGSVEVIGHRIAPRYPPAAPAPPPVRRASPPAKKSKPKSSSALAPPMPLPPAPPRNWLQLSRPQASNLPGYVAHPAPNASTAFDDWSLVRMPDTSDPKADVRIGWVLSRMLAMSIPDEVAQYAEGHRITAYVALGEIRDKDRNETKSNWLWTTSSLTQVPFEFDSFRVFVWSIRRHRYETAYIERNVKGHYPVETQTLAGQDEKAFSLVLQDKDGKLYKRTYAFSGFRVHMIAKTPVSPVQALPEVRSTRGFDPAPATPAAESGWREKLSDLRKRWFGK
jgi:hypothetical protein